MAEVGAVRINKRVAKSSSSVSDGDFIEIAYPTRLLSVLVLTSNEVLLKRNALAFEIKDDKRVFDGERPW